ncbi:TRAP transporter small permease [Rhodovulum sp. FJ3]|uniref:TRAP transporter small permease n=1 Tax=Rhodovulum sp. FJ3 TaxID=3079053 RepID=UPI00293DD9D8|nr:TRAP transporter small permease [Rhodovulum sp. FJ3]MDV4169353.1 TRAP transporter small permease [Rhodovulum sp. FJ3]
MPAGDTKKGGGVGRPLFSLFKLVDRVIEVSGQAIIVGTLAATFFALLVNVFLRYIMGDGLAWAYEIHSILFPWLVAGGIAVASVRAHHISVDVLVSVLPAPVRAAVAILVNALICAIAVTVVYTSQPIVNASKFQRLSEIPVSQYWGYISLYYAFTCMALNAAMNVVRLILSGQDAADNSPVSYS